MKIFLTLGFIVIICIGCASGPPALTSVVPKTTEAAVSPELSQVKQEPVQEVKRPKATGNRRGCPQTFSEGHGCP